MTLLLIVFNLLQFPYGVPVLSVIDRGNESSTAPGDHVLYKNMHYNVEDCVKAKTSLDSGGFERVHARLATEEGACHFEGCVDSSIHVDDPIITIGFPTRHVFHPACALKEYDEKLHVFYKEIQKRTQNGKGAGCAPPLGGTKRAYGDVFDM